MDRNLWFGSYSMVRRGDACVARTMLAITTVAIRYRQ